MFGIYVHVPFCMKKCDYCDFYSEPIGRADPPHAEYLNAILSQLERDCSLFVGRRLSTVYFGGGTPSLMPPEFFKEILAAIATRFPCEEKIEINCEVNPATADIGWFRAARAAGITRVSIGVQSFQDRLLEYLGRVHTAEDAMRAIAEAQEVGFESVSVDLMYGMPSETVKDLEEDVRVAMTFQPRHVSAYVLTLEEGTPLFDRLSGIETDDEQLNQMRIVARMLSRGGWQRYEISNFAKPGFECRHNLNYWRYGEYLGLGAGAASFVRNDTLTLTLSPRGRGEGEGADFARRWTQVRNVNAYLSNKDALAEDETIDRRTAMAEFCFMGLRAAEGISPADFKRLFGEEFEKVFPGKAGALAGEGLASQDGGRLVLTQRGIEISNRVFERFMA